MKTTIGALLVLMLAVASPGQQDDFKRERNEKTGAAKDALEGKTAPALQVEKWMNTDGLVLKDLVGKVVVLDFWGTW
jgi:hypothetical protein